MKWTRLNVPAPFLEADQELVGIYQELKWNLRVIVSKDQGFWHISISHPKRYPTFDEIKAARYDLVPDEANMAMFFPSKNKYVNVHPNCFHLYEVKEPSRIIAPLPT